MSESIELTRTVPGSPERIFKAWLAADEHTRMTGGQATVQPDGRFTAWDGYIEGRTLEEDAPRRIVQAWRTTEFPDGAPDSRVEVLLEPQGDGTAITLKHSDIPDGQGASYESGWVEHYFDPMTEYFGSAEAKLREAGDKVTEAAHAAGAALDQVGETVTETVQGAVEALETASEQVRETAQRAAKQATKAAKTVKKQATKAAKSVKRLVAKAKAKLQPKGKAKAAAKKKAKPAKKAAKPKVAAKKKSPAPKPKKKAAAKKRR